MKRKACNLVLENICILIFVCLVFVNAEASLEKGGGYNVLVSFSQNVKQRDGRVRLERMKVSLQDASGILYGAVGHQFTKVTFKIPDSWDISEWNITTDGSSISRESKPHFLIDSTNDVVFGKFPFAQQYGSCGTPGHQIIVPSAFLTDANKFPKGTALAREWLKYRYGVFDENGFEGDPLYPLYYILPGEDPNEVKITECTNYPVIYNYKDQAGAPCSESDKPLINRLDSKECNIMPDEESLENVTSSVMYFQKDIPSMQHICGTDPDHKHNALSPNKHNAMCRGLSVWDVVKKSEDFQEGSTAGDYGDIEFVYAREAKTKVIVAWENTIKVNKTKGNMILNSIKRFVYDLPTGSKFSGFPFSRALSDVKDYTLKELNNLDDKNNVMVNIKSDFVSQTDANINLAVAKALDILSDGGSNSEPEGTVIIISKSSGALSDRLLERLQKSRVCVMLLYLSEGGVPDEAKNYVSSLPCGSLEDIPAGDSSEYMFEKLFAIMETILPSNADDKVTEAVKTGYVSKDSPITLQVDETVAEVTFWIFTDKESENFVLTFNGVNEKFRDIKTTAVMALSFSPRQAGSIEFRYPHDTVPMFTQVTVTSKAGKYLNGYVITHDTTEKSSPGQMPVILYAVIRYGAYPVQNASVWATVERPNNESVTFEMFDDGRGDPDITQNDGVYSRYFTQFSEVGDYTVTVKVETGELTSYGIDGNAGYRPCCGSVLKLASTKVPVSSKEFKTSFAAKRERPEGGYKPSRILDLKIDKIDGDKIILKWSAPGEEGDSGTVESYDIKCYPSHEEALNDQNGIPLNNSITPAERGGTQTLEIVFSDFESPGKYYITIAAKNTKQTGDTSNILEIFVPNEETTTSNKETDETTDENKDAAPQKKTALIIGLVVGLIVLIIIIFLVVYFLVIKPRRKELKENPVYDVTKRHENNTNNANNVMNPINFIPADTLLKHHEERTRAKMQNKEPPIFSEEDFETSQSSPTPEPGDNSNTQQPEGRDKPLANGEALPPKSPKKTTYV